MKDPAPLLAEMRLVKNEGDWKMGLRQAIDISAQAHIEAFKAIRPGMDEYEVQAVFEYVYRKNGSPRNAYPCIVGSGPNSCTLHYSKNARAMRDGEMVLMDCAAEYGYYAADITRTVPVSGKFSKEQRDIYQLVLDAQNAAIHTVKPGIAKNLLDSVMNSVLGNGLVTLGFIKDPKDSRIFTLHGFSHWIGLEVHDVGRTTVDGKPRALAAGMVFTLEPGIYIRPDVFDKMKDLKYTDGEIAKMRARLDRYMNIGVRIEDDVVVTEDGCKNLSEAAPRDIGAIEALMRHGP
jgi:Xaa-Pro aminopeptidase